MNQTYLDTARMMVQVAPFVFTDDRLALKGGTAINLFLRDMPRLSVDLDLTFTDYRVKRADALAAINDAMRRSAERLEQRGFHTQIAGKADGIEAKLLVRRGKTEVKIETNYVIRGAVNTHSRASLARKAREVLFADVEVPILSAEDIYAGKIVAALDRQHPRDLFDIMQLFAHGGITPGIRRSFIIYLASHNRPIHEVLFPNEREISAEYGATFRGMTAEDVSLSELLSAREHLMNELPNTLATEEREFLMSLANADPRWELLGIEHAQQLPAIKWKVQNLRKLAKEDNAKLRAQADELYRRFQAL